MTLSMPYSTEVTDSVDEKHWFTLTSAGDLETATARYFGMLHEIKQLHPEIKVLLVPWFPSIGLGNALNDRLNRGSET